MGKSRIHGLFELRSTQIIITGIQYVS